jgi:hypothetical protein
MLRFHEKEGRHPRIGMDTLDCDGRIRWLAGVMPWTWENESDAVIDRRVERGFGHHLVLGRHLHLDARGHYLPAAVLLARRAQALLQESPHRQTAPEQDQWLRDHGLFLSLQDHFPQFGLMLALCSPAR